jgi:Protein of unknown function (DUF2587)
MMGIMNPSQDEQQGLADDNQPRQGVVVSQDGAGVANPPGGNQNAGGPATSADSADQTGTAGPTDMIEHPGKVMRIASMIKQLLEEVRSAPLDQAGRTRLAEIHRRSIRELEQGLGPELIDELERITLPLSDEAPSDAELRIAQAQLVGWLEGLFHGMQAALFAQQMVAQQQLETMRRALPPGPSSQAGGPSGQAGGPGQHPDPGMPARPDPRDNASTGQYL